MKENWKKEAIKGVLHARLQENLVDFVKRCFEELNPGQKYLHNWHIDELCWYLTGAYLGKENRLIVTMPPRYLKSICISVAFPAWVLGREPEKRVIVASYGEKLAAKHSLDTKKVMNSPWYARIFPDLKLASGQNSKTKFVTTKGGFRLAASVGGALTGEGGDFLILDDPHKPSAIASELQRNKVYEWFEGTFLTRLNNKKTGAVVIVMQRLHADDLVGRLLEAKKGWVKLDLQALAEQDEKYRAIGEALHEARESASDLQALRGEMGEGAFAAQYQQRPEAARGGFFKEAWFKFYDPSEVQLKGEAVFLSVDSAGKTGEANDYTAISIWAARAKEYYLMELLRKKMEFPELCKLVKATAEEWGASFILVEDKSSGISLLQELFMAQLKAKIVPVKVKHEKAVRFFSASGTFERGWVLFNKNLALLSELKAELMGFPHVKHDDMTDSITNFLNWYTFEFIAKTSRKSAPSLRSLS